MENQIKPNLASEKFIGISTMVDKPSIPYQTTPAKKARSTLPSLPPPQPLQTPKQLRQEIDRLIAANKNLQTTINFLQERLQRSISESQVWKERYENCNAELRSRFIQQNGGKLF